jgi:ParB-like chromosome segregation protein Spo0J
MSRLRTAAEREAAGFIRENAYRVHFDKLVPNPDNPRDLSLPEEAAALAELTAELKPGFDEDRPFLVREIKFGSDAGKWMVWDGNRRLRALGPILAADADYTRFFPIAKVTDGASEIDLQYIALRSPSRPLAPLAEANHIYGLVKKGQSVEEIARRMHKGVDYVKGRLELREAPEAVKAAVNHHRIAPTEARHILKTADPVATLAAAEQAAGGGKMRTRHVRAAVEASAPTPRQTALPAAPRRSPLERAAQAHLTAFRHWAARKPVKDLLTAEVIGTIESLDAQLPHEAAE